MLKYTNIEKTAAQFNGAFFSLAAPENFSSIGDGPTREAVLKYLSEGNLPENYVISSEQILAEKKAQRQAIVDAITVTTSTGKVFDGNEEAQSRMSRAIQTAQIANIPSTTWVLANNVPTTVTLAELQEALVLSMQAMGAVWATPYED